MQKDTATSTPTTSPTSIKKSLRRRRPAPAKKRKDCGLILQSADARATQKYLRHHEACVHRTRDDRTLCPVYLQVCLSEERLPYRDSYSESWYCSGFSFLCPNLSRRSVPKVRGPPRTTTLRY